MDDPHTAAVAAYEEWLGERPTTVAVAPGRVNLVGGHVDYNDGIVLPAPIDRTTAVAAGTRGDDRVRVRSLTTGETVTARLDSIPDGWAAYPVGAVAALAETRDVSGANLLITGDVPLGAGLSSSAALCVAVVGAVDALRTLERPDTGQRDGEPLESERSDGDWSDGEQPDAEVPDGERKADEPANAEQPDTATDRLGDDRIAEIAWRAETAYVGTDCGVMDQLTSACGRAGHALRIDCRDRAIRPVPVPDEATLLVVDTTVSHELREGGYNQRVAECREAVERLAAALDRPLGSLRDVTPAEVASVADRLGEPYAARARHVTSEIERVNRAVSALESGDLTELGALMTEAHRSLADDYAVSCAEVEAVVAGLRSVSGVHGARLVGGGWGGSVVALTDSEAVRAAAEAARERCERETGVTPEAYETRVGDGLRVQRLSE